MAAPLFMGFRRPCVNLMTQNFAYKTGITETLMPEFIPNDPKMIVHHISNLMIMFRKFMSYQHGCREMEFQFPFQSIPTGFLWEFP